MLYKTKEYLQEQYLDLRRSQYDIAKEWGIDPKLLHYYIKKNGLTGKGKIKHLCNESKFKIKDPVFCYYAGLIATDGYVDLKNNRVSIRVSNEGSAEVLTNLKNHFEFTGDIKVYKGNNDLTITSKKLISSLSVLNVKGERKTYTLRFPKMYCSDEDCMRMFLRGVLDGDGNIHVTTSKHTNKKCRGQFRLVTASEDFIQGVINYLNRKFDFKYLVSYATIKGVRYPKLEMRVEDSLKFYDWVYKGYEDFRFHDKYSKYKQLIG